MHARSWFPVVVVHVHVRVHENAFVEREKETMEGTNEKKAKGNGNEQGAEESEWGVGVHTDHASGAPFHLRI